MVQKIREKQVVRITKRFLTSLPWDQELLEVVALFGINFVIFDIDLKKKIALNSAGCLVLKKKKCLSDFVKNKFLHDGNFKF